MGKRKSPETKTISVSVIDDHCGYSIEGEISKYGELEQEVKALWADSTFWKFLTQKPEVDKIKSEIRNRKPNLSFIKVPPYFEWFKLAADPNFRPVKLLDNRAEDPEIENFVEFIKSGEFTEIVADYFRYPNNPQKRKIVERWKEKDIDAMLAGLSLFQKDLYELVKQKRSTAPPVHPKKLHGKGKPKEEVAEPFPVWKGVDDGPRLHRKGPKGSESEVEGLVMLLRQEGSDRVDNEVAKSFCSKNPIPAVFSTPQGWQEHVKNQVAGARQLVRFRHLQPVCAAVEKRGERVIGRKPRKGSGLKSYSPPFTLESLSAARSTSR